MKAKVPEGVAWRSRVNGLNPINGEEPEIRVKLVQVSRGSVDCLVNVYLPPMRSKEGADPFVHAMNAILRLRRDNRIICVSGRRHSGIIMSLIFEPIPITDAFKEGAPLQSLVKGIIHEDKENGRQRIPLTNRSQNLEDIRATVARANIRASPSH